jgi:sodium-dependent dicarboxylate transporter 2/3/5
MNLTKKTIGLLLGPMVFFSALVFQPDTFSTDAWKVICVASFMLVWWVSEAVPIPVTSLLPILLLPWLDVMPISEAAEPYASDIVFLFLGGFMLALALEKWNLHRRIALNIVRITGTGANRIILGFMLATAALSMWISNTATAVMMLPIALSVVNLLLKDEENTSKGVRNFALVLMLGIAYGANVGGIATLIGTPPNIVMAGILKTNHGIDISFFEWMKVGLPFSLVMLFVTYWFLTYVLFPNKLGTFKKAEAIIDREIKALGPLTHQEVRVLVIFVGTALLWIFRKVINDNLSFIELTDAGIAIFASVMLFVVFVGDKTQKSLLAWKDTEKLPWGILLLFGGGLSLANALKVVGLIDMIGDSFTGLGEVNPLWIILGLATVSLFLTELMSNVALTSVFVPLVAAVAVGVGQDPLDYAVPVTLAASCAFMLPMSTPPNAIVFASGHISVAQMVRGGIVLNIVAILMIWLFCTYLFPILIHA